MSLCVFFEGTGQGVAGCVTNVTRMRDLCHESSRQRFHLEAGSGTRFGSYIGGRVARRAVSMRVRDGGNVRNDGALAVDATPSLRSCARTHTTMGALSLRTSASGPTADATRTRNACLISTGRK